MPKTELGYLGWHQLGRRPRRYFFASIMGVVMGALLALLLVTAASIERAWIDSAQLKTAGHSAVIVPADAEQRSQLFDEPGAHPIWQGQANAFADDGMAPDVGFYFTTTRPPIDRFMGTGTPPGAPGEIAVSKQVAAALGVTSGDLLQVGTEEFEITGLFHVPAPPDDMISIAVITASSDFEARAIGLDELTGPTIVTSDLTNSGRFDLIRFNEWSMFSRDSLPGLGYTVAAIAPISAAGISIFAVALWIVVMSLAYRRSRDDVLALAQSGFPVAQARSSVFWPQLFAYVGSLLLGSFVISAVLVVWSRPVSWLFGQEWVSVSLPVATWVTMLAGVVCACGVITLLATHWQYTNNRSAVGSSAAIWVVPGLLSLGLILYSPKDTPLWFLVGTVGAAVLSSLLAWTILISFSGRGVKRFLLHQRNMTTVVLLLGLLIFVPTTFFFFDTVYVTRLSAGPHPYVPHDAVTINSVRQADVGDLVLRLSASGPKSMTVHRYGMDSSHIYQVTTSEAVSCFEAEGSSDFRSQCYSAETIGIASSTVDGGYSSSSSWRVRPSLIDDDGHAGLLVFDKATGEFVRSELVAAVPAEEFGHPYVVAGQMPGRQARALTNGEGDSDIVIRDFTSLDDRTQAEIYQIAFEEAPYTAVLTPDSGTEDASTRATGIVVFAVGFVASLLIVGGALRNFALADSGLDQTARTMNMSGARRKYVVLPAWATLIGGYVATLVILTQSKSLWAGYSMWDVCLLSSVTVIAVISIVLPPSLLLARKSVKEW